MIRAPTAVVLLILGLHGCGGRLPEYPPVVTDGDVVRIPLETVADGEAHFFTFTEGGKRVNFLVRTDGEGVLRAHLDACFGCYRYRRGFAVEGRDLVCRACRLAYALEDDVWDFIGACAPISIRHSVVRDDLVIDRKVLERAGRYF